MLCYEDADKEAQCACVRQPHLTWLDWSCFTYLLVGDIGEYECKQMMMLWTYDYYCDTTVI